MLIQPREYLVTSPFVNLLVLVSWFCITGSYLICCVLLFFVSVLCVRCGQTVCHVVPKIYLKSTILSVKGGGSGATASGSKLGDKMDILNEKFDFLHSTNFKLLSEIEGNSINNCDFF